jgi:hypothetical protein
MIKYEIEQVPFGFGHPPAARLNADYDVGALDEDLHRLREHQWDLQQNYTSTGPGRYAAFDWRALPLRSPDGSPSRTDPGGPARHEYAYTPWVDHAPYLGELLRGIPAPLRTARLLALGPGAASKVHWENKIGLPFGNVRLHVPIVTNPKAVLTIDGSEYHWEPGSLWFGDFYRDHKVENNGTETRIHMLVDSLLTPELYEWFPAEFRESVNPDHVLFSRRSQPLTKPVGDYECAFDMPEIFTDWEEPFGLFREPQEQIPTRITADGDDLLLVQEGRETFCLIHLGEEEFRFAGWTDERTLRLQLGDHRPTVTLYGRQGTRTATLDVPARPA